MPSRVRAWYAAFVFALTLPADFLERGIPTLPARPFERDLVLTGTRVSRVMGFAFAVFHVVPGLPIAQVTAPFLRVFNVAGFGSGPTVAAPITDHVYGHDADMKRSSATNVPILGPTAAIVIWWGLKHYGRAVARAMAWD